jgi:hypothetical protein
MQMQRLAGSNITGLRRRLSLRQSRLWCSQGEIPAITIGFGWGNFFRMCVSFSPSPSAKQGRELAPLSRGHEKFLTAVV